MFLKLAKKDPCRMYRARLEETIRLSKSKHAGTSASAPADPELATHLRECLGCQKAFEDAMLAGELLREGRAPQSDPDQLFASRVIARIRARETKLHSEFEFWNPIEVLARRVVWASSVLLLILSSALYQTRGFHWAVPAQEGIADRFPDLAPDHPSDKDEVLVSLAEKAHE
ncbi:MAG TPA: hypothetical protein VOA41_15060 [Candidatus Dormibacteraeota bacterium]|nr:hypothetical protein [Candidatus Dormibacteraeota bacterium]